MFEPGILFMRIDKASLVFLDFVLLRTTEVPIAAVSEECSHHQISILKQEQPSNYHSTPKSAPISPHIQFYALP